MIPIPPPNVVAGGAAAISKFLSHILGVAPRGDLQKFGRVVYPMMQDRALSSGFSCFALWFGDTVEVRPNGDVVVVGAPGTIVQFEADMATRAKTEFFYVLRCPASISLSGITEQQFRGQCSFAEMGTASGGWFGGPGAGAGGPGAAAPDTILAGLGGTGTLAIIGGGLLLGFLVTRK